jgi:hypothetical protein
MNKEEKLADIERRQRELADEIAELKKPTEQEFIKGHFYESNYSLVICTDPRGNGDGYFTGINIRGTCGSLKDDDGWVKESFHEVAIETKPVDS